MTRKSGWECCGRYCGSWYPDVSMTKVTLHYALLRPLNDDDLSAIANVHSTYGIERVQVAPALDKITVDYDASRLMKSDVESVLARHGFPIRTVAEEIA
jgi:hypothetical protein